MSIKSFKETHFSKHQLELVFEEVNSLFDPPLKQRVLNRSDVQTFSDYLDKILMYGTLLIQYDEEDIQGILSFYANDVVNKHAYISLVCVREAFQQRGVGISLLKHAKNQISTMGMKEIVVKTWKGNNSAIYLYQKSGFTVSNIDNNDVILRYKFI